MHYFGTYWEIDGVKAAYVSRGPENGTYRVVFEREYAELPAIEAIHWDKPTIRPLRLDRPGELGLPEGYGFQVEGITYDSATRSYTVALKTDRQYLGDVTGYQAQIDDLTQTVAERDAAIAAWDQELEALRADGSAAAEELLREAYTEGVEAHG